MNYKEKLELKLEILEDIYECFQFNWGSGDDSISMKKMSDLLDRYKYQLEGISKNENND